MGVWYPHASFIAERLIVTRGVTIKSVITKNTRDYEQQAKCMDNVVQFITFNKINVKDTSCDCVTQCMINISEYVYLCSYSASIE